MRVVALRAEASLAAALNMSLAWEVAYATEPEEAADIIGDAAVILIGGGTDEGLRLAESMRSLGVTIPAVIVGDLPAPASARHPVLTPPFTLDELHRVVEQATSAAGQSVPPSTLKAEPTREREDHYVTNSDREVRHLEVAPAPSQPEPAVAPVVAVASPPAEAPSVEFRPQDAQEPATSEQLGKGARGVHIEREQRSYASGRNLLRRRAKPLRQQTEENDVRAKLRAAFAGVASLEKALSEVPVLTNLIELSQALMSEVVDLLTPDTAGLYLPGPDGFRVWASHNFSTVEKQMVIQTHQPLFADLLVRHEALLIEPLDLAHGLANGVGGARTNAFLASPIELERTCFGVIVAGRGHFENEDLDRLDALSEEAAPGLAVALGLDRLRNRFH